MADQEVIKHTKKLYKVWNSNEHSTLQKLKEFFIEIFIIVFAVSLSIWLHSKSEHAHQQKVVTEFLVGLKSDLQNDINEMSEDKGNYQQSKKAFAYLLRASKANFIEQDSLKKYQQALFSMIKFNPNDGRYEGFKSSGNIGHIEDRTLQNDIVDYFQEDTKTLLLTTNYYASWKNNFFEFYIKNHKRENGKSNIIPLLLRDEAQNYITILSQLDEVIARYDVCIDKAKKIVSEIKQENE